MELSMQAQPSNESMWPANAIPERWVEALFDTMAANYGARFADLWRGTDFEKVKKHWGVELARLSSTQMKAGRESIGALLRPPTCPEFIAHCRQCRVEAVASEAFQLEHAPTTTPEKAVQNIKALDAMLMRMRTRSEPNAEWAFRTVLRGKSESGKPLGFSVSNAASDAITSSAGRKVVEDCIDPDLKQQYAEIRQTIVDGYRMRGRKLWETP
jgi:hypothetical protein